MFDNIKQEDRVGGLNRSPDSEILIVDFMNTFIRSFMASPSLSSNGDHTGGIAGCLKSIGAAVKLINPTRLIIVSDGNGGSLKRKKIYPEYKTDFTSKVKDPNWVPPWPIFMPGQAVYTEMYGIRYEGIVGYDNVESAMIRVNWKDGSSQFAAKMNLVPIVKKTYKKVYNSRRSKNEGK